VRWKGGWVTSTTWCGWKDGSRVKDTYRIKEFSLMLNIFLEKKKKKKL
jgi:hypothetical protein